jgi:gas vesicle protein
MLDHLDLRFIREREDEAATKGFFGGLMLGILLGVVLALVFAPRRGDETRAAVMEKAGDLKHKAAEMVGRAGEVVPDTDAVSDGDVAIEREIALDEPVSQQAT